MTAPLACTRCGTAYEIVGANHVHDSLCPRCVADPEIACDSCGEPMATSEARFVGVKSDRALCRDARACGTRVAYQEREFHRAADMLGKVTT